MDTLICKGHTALEYAKQACDTIMKKFSPEDLPPKGEFYYHQGVFLSGMQKTYELCQEEKYYAYVKAWVDCFVWKDGSIHHFDGGQLDYIQPGVLFYQIYEKSGDERYKKALHRLLSVIDDFPKNAEGGFWHNKDCPNQMWLDGLYMAGPICSQFAAVFEKSKYFNLVADQALLMERKTKDANAQKGTGIFVLKIAHYQ